MKKINLKARSVNGRNFHVKTLWQSNLMSEILTDRSNCETSDIWRKFYWRRFELKFRCIIRSRRSEKFKTSFVHKIINSTNSKEMPLL